MIDAEAQNNDQNKPDENLTTESGELQPQGEQSEPEQIQAQPPRQQETSSHDVRSAGEVKAPPPKEQEITAPSMVDDAELEREIAEALGDQSLVDLYQLEEEKKQIKPQETSAEDKEKSAQGVTKGKVVGISGDDIFIDLGGKSQGMLSREEIGEDEKLEVGMTMQVCIVGYDQKDGLIIVSRKTAQQQLLRRDLKIGSMVEARVVGSNKGGLEMDLRGLKAFMPASQIDIERTEDFDSLMGERYICEVIEVERGDRNLVLSRRKVLLIERKEREKLLWAELEKGQSRHGVVRSLMDFGAFVDLGGVDGLLHVSEMSWARVKHPKEILQVGQEIDVVVIEADKKKRRVSLSLKLAGGDPWSTAEHKYPVGSRHQAQVMNLQDFGAFAQLEPGLEGLIPVSEMSWVGRVRHPKDVVQAGTMVEVEILSLDSTKRRIALSMKQVQENPWQTAAQNYAVDGIYKGKVARLTDFGAFVTLEEGVDGLIHISEMAEGRVNRAGDVVKMGEEVTVRVINVDGENQRISLSLKGLESAGELPDQASDEKAQTDKAKKNRPRRGGLLWDDSSKWGGLGDLKL
jgi:small subunit ribosomal protein S1